MYVFSDAITHLKSPDFSQKYFQSTNFSISELIASYGE